MVNSPTCENASDVLLFFAITVHFRFVNHYKYERLQMGALMVSLVEVTEYNYYEICSLKVSPEQESYVAPAVSILARAYAKRNRNARALAIKNGETIVGVLMYMELHEEPACYTIEQFLIDHKYQNRSYGKQALGIVIEMLANERKYEAIEICVKMEDAQAIKVYRDSGFADTGYIDPDASDSYCFRYDFT